MSSVTGTNGAAAPGALVIAGITAVLKDLLGNRLAQRGVAALVGDVTVTALPPDRIAVGAEERPQLNLFLYRIAPNTRWRSSNGGAPTLALDLSYLITAYGEQELQHEVLLGHAAQVLHETVGFSPERLQQALEAAAKSATNGGPRASLGGIQLHARAEVVEIVPEFPGMEEMSKLWSALQARYRPSLTYRVSAVPLGAVAVNGAGSG